MARFDTSGIDDIIKEMKKMGELVGEAADEMLMAGAEEVKESWREAAQAHKLHDTGDMIESIGYPKQPKTVAGIKEIDIYPQGKDRNGKRNVEKAFILHYGTSSGASIARGQKKAAKKKKKYKNPGIPATHWVDDADKIAGPRVQRVMEEKFDELLVKKGMK